MKFSNDTLRIAVRYWLANPVKAVPIYGHISSWNTSEVTDMSQLFKDAESFNQPIGDWDVSNVNNMSEMFLRAKAFNQPIGNWDVGNVIVMNSMFSEADVFNQPINSWDVSSVTNMCYMFYNAYNFNQPIVNWDVSEVTDILYVLHGANSYNKPLNKVGKGYWIKKTFHGASWHKEKLKTKSKINFRGQLIGFHKEYHENGQLKLEVNFTNGIQDDGEVITYHTNGIKARKVMILNQKISGEFSEYHENGNIKTQGYYEKDLCYIEKDFDENGIICDFTVTKFDNDSLVDVLKLWHHERNLIETRYGHISNWDVSKVTNMYRLFKYIDDFNEDISNWDVSNVKNMRSMFSGAKAFNQPIGNWDVSKVTNMYEMFYRAKAFNQPIGNWDVSNVKSMREMFYTAISFNQPIGTWDVSKVTNMHGMFSGAIAFNQPIGNWDVGNVKNMRSMFSGAEAFNQPIGNWDVSNVTNMKKMFWSWSTPAFNQPIGSWDVSNVENMFEMFSGAQVFNQPLGNWNISWVTTMKCMFSRAESFNQDLSKWPEINSLVKFNRQMFSKEFAKYYDVNSLTRKVDTSTFNKNSKKAIPKIKKLLKTRDYNYVDSALELLRSLEDKSLYEYFLAGVKINSDGTLVTTNIFSGSRQAQPYFDYALISLINFAPKNLNIHESIKRKNIKALKLSAMLAVNYGLPQDGYSDLPDCGVFTTSKIPNLAFDNLEEISIFNYQNLESLKFLLNCKKLKRIELKRCDNIKDADLFKKQILKNE